MDHVFDCTYSKEIMDKLVSLYQSHSATAMLGLHTCLYTLRTERFTSLKDLFATHQERVRQLDGMGEAVAQSEILHSLLVAIPEKFKHVLGALSVIRKEELYQLSREQLQRIFLDAEEAGNQAEPKLASLGDSHPVAMVGPSNPRRNRTTVCFECKKVGHKRRNCFVL